MAGDNDTSGPIPHQATNRCTTGDVEIVGWLVQKQEVRCLDDETGNTDAHPLATRQRSETTV